MKAQLAKLSLALLSAVFLLGCQEQASSPVGLEGLDPQFRHGGKPPHGAPGPGGDPGKNVEVTLPATLLDGTSDPNGIESSGPQSAQIVQDGAKLNVCCGDRFDGTLNLTTSGGDACRIEGSMSEAELKEFLEQTIGNEEQPTVWFFQVDRKNETSRKHILRVNWTIPGQDKRIIVTLRNDNEFGRLTVTERPDPDGDADKSLFTFTGGAADGAVAVSFGGLVDPESHLVCPYNGANVELLLDRTPPVD